MRRKLIMFGFCFSAALTGAYGANLLQNSSFEVGLRGWDYWKAFGSGVYHLREYAARVIEPQIDLSTAYEGKASLKVLFPADIKELATYEIKTGLYPTEKGRTNTFSVYLRSDQPNVPVLLCLTCGTGHQRVIDQQVRVQDTWQRFSVTGVINDTLVGAKIFLTPGAAGRTVWLDAAQLETGPLTEYAGRSEAEIGITGAALHNIYGSGKKITPEVRFHRYLKGAGEYEVDYQVMETMARKAVATRSEKVRLAEEETLAKPLPLELNSNRLGLYKIVGRLKDGAGKVVDTCEYIYAVYDPIPVPENFEEDSIFGLNHVFGLSVDANGNNFAGVRESFEDYVKLASDIGCRWNRIFNLAAWRTIEPEKGKFQFKNDYVVDLCDKYKIRLMPILGFEIWPACIPRWALSNETDGQEKFRPDVSLDHFRLPKTNDWYSYVYETVKHYKGRVTHWEVFNEPNLYILDPKKYAALLQTAYDAAKAADPQAKIVGCCVTEGYHHGQPTSDYVAAVLKAVGPKLDILSMHFYYGPTTMVPELEVVPLDKCIEAQKEVLRQYGVKQPVIWDTESNIETASYYTQMAPLGVWNRAPNTLWEGKNPEADQFRGAAYMARKFLIYQAHQVKWDFFALAPICVEYSGSGTLIEYDGTPKLVYLVYGALARALHKAKTLKKVTLGEKVYGYLFEKGEKYLLTLCNTDDKEGALVLDTDQKQIEVLDMVGNPVEVKAEGERTTLPIGAAPIFVWLPKELGQEKIIKTFESAELLGVVPFKMALGLAQDPKSKQPATAIEIKNTSVRDVTVEAEIAGIPKEWSMAKKQVKIGPVPPGQSVITYAVFDRISPRDEPMRLRARSRLGDEMLEAAQEIARVGEISKAKQKPAIDGAVNESEWEGAAICAINKKDRVVVGDASAWQGPADLSGTVSVLWDEEALYVGLRAQCKHFIQNKKDPEALYNSTCLELFLSLAPTANIWNSLYTANDYQLLFAPKTEENPNCYYSGVGGRDTDRKMKLAGIEIASRRAEGGYEMEIKIPWRNFQGFVPGAGKVIGFDVALDGADTKGDRQYQMVWSGTANNCVDVSRWARMILKE